MNELLASLTNLINNPCLCVKGYRKNLHLFFSLLFAFFILNNDVLAQDKKKLEDLKLIALMKSTEHSAQKATIYSAIIPGWGQAYNKKYWKVPIVWAGLATVGYFIYSNQSNYNNYKDYYIYLRDNPDSTIATSDPLRPLTSSDLSTILANIGTFRKNRDLSVIVLFAVWGLNVIDANVDGHFFDFDIDEDLSLNLRPAAWAIGQRKQAYGLNLVFTMH